MSEEQDPTGPARPWVVAGTFFALAAASVGAVQISKPDAGEDPRLVFQETMTSGPTGARTWETFAGRRGAVCGTTSAPGTITRNFVAVWPDVFRVDDDSNGFKRLWRARCAPVPDGRKTVS